MRKARELTPEERAALEAVAAMPEEKIDTDDVPERRDWSGAVRGMLYRPRKEQLTLRLDADVLEWFKAHGGARGYQTRINAALREYVAAHERESG